MILSEHFDRIILISLKRNRERRARVFRNLRAGMLASRIQVLNAWDGSELPAPAWWGAGNGAWGCLQSHVRALHEAWQSGVESVLIMEDDVCWQPNAAEMLGEFLDQVPEDWEQLYLGGQHQQTPELVVDRPAVFLGRSVNRTHAYAVRRSVIPAVISHILHAPDYIGTSNHVDHQLERAHQRRDWRVYCPTWWIAGQEENQSDINGRTHPRKWWHYDEPAQVGKLPFVVVDEEPEDLDGLLHFGWDFERCGKTPKNLGEGWTTLGSLHTIMRGIAREAFEMERLPAVWEPPHKAGRDALLSGWPEDKVMKLSEVRSEIPRLAAYPWNGLFPHPWIKPFEQ